MLEARITTRKIEVDLVPALRSSYSWEQGRQLTVTQGSDSSARVPTKELGTEDEEARHSTWVEPEKAQKSIKSFPGRERNLEQMHQSMKTKTKMEYYSG